MRSLNLSVALSCIFLSACAERVVEVNVPFDEAAAREALKPGPNSIEGQGFLRQQGGGVVTCAGEEVELYPALAYSKARVTGVYGTVQGGTLGAFQGASQENLPPAYIAVMRKTSCDAEGDFAFTGLADGEYYVTTLVAWTVGDSWIPEGGRITKLVQVQGGQTARVLLN